MIVIPLDVTTGSVVGATISTRYGGSIRWRVATSNTSTGPTRSSDWIPS